MPAVPNPRRRLYRLLTDCAGLIVNSHLHIRGRPNLLWSGDDGNGIKKVPRGVKGSCRDRDGHRHVRHRARAKILAKEQQCEIGIPLMGCDDVRAMRSIQKADNAIELALRIIQLGQDV